MVKAVVGFVADAQPGTGLGHISRCSAIALALSCKGVDVDCHALGSELPLERDGIEWQPLASLDDAPASFDAVVMDSYVLSPEDELRFADGRPLILMPERTRIDHATLAVETRLAPDDRPDHLFGPRYACLRSPFWGAEPRPFGERVESVLVTMGAYDSTGLTVPIAQIAREVVSDARITVVRGPRAQFEPPAGVELIEAPDDMLVPLLGTDIVVCAGGQTSLEAAATGTPSITLTLIDNQAGNAQLLGDLGASISIVGEDLERVRSALRELVDDPARRKLMRDRALQGVDGFGAHRVASRVTRLLR